MVDQVQMGMSLADFIRLYDEEGPFELLNGERIAQVPTIARHNVVTRTIFRRMDTFAEAHQLGEVFSEAPFILPGTYSADWVKDSRVPDVMFIAAARLAVYKAGDPTWDDKPYVIVPDLVVEVVSPNDTYSKVETKIEQYLADGVQVLWLVDPQRRTVQVYYADRDWPDKLRDGDTLIGGDPLLGFTLPVQDIFAV
jgi:Uma2 family endonuclease